jgi:hypothetical protein
VDARLPVYRNNKDTHSEVASWGCCGQELHSGIGLHDVESRDIHHMQLRIACLDMGGKEPISSVRLEGTLKYTKHTS